MLATLTAGMAYQVIFSPPGGFWKNSVNDPKGRSSHSVELSILGSYDGEIFALLIVLNSVRLMGSLSTIMLVLCGFPNRNKFFIWLLIFTVFITITCMAATYGLTLFEVFSDILLKFRLPRHIFTGQFMCWVGLSSFVAVLHTIHFVLWLRNKIRKLIRICTRRGPRATHVE